MKRMLVTADMHCGHRVGLTPPDWQSTFVKNSRTQHNKYAELQKEAWRWYKKKIDALQPIDILAHNGDAIDGKGSLSGTTEQREADRVEQIEMAIACIECVKAKEIVMTFGTGYHVGNAEDWESLIANAVNAKIGSHEWPEVNGVIFDLKHHVGGSSIPHGRHTATARDMLWNELYAIDGKQPRADFLLRSHVHYYSIEGNAKKTAWTTPALQCMGTKFGARRCSGLVDFGFMWFDIDEKGNTTWHTEIADLKLEHATTTKM